MILSIDDEPVEASPRLFDVASRAIDRARHINLEHIKKRNDSSTRFVNLWPGDHYRLLAAMVELEQPQLVIEIGTYEGLSAVAMAEFLKPGARIVTYDVIPWQTLPNTCLRQSDFSSGQIEQYVDDLSNKAALARHQPLLSEADMIFIDAAKDGVLETKLLENLDTVAFRRPPLVIFDDIRVWNMLPIWRSVRRPKLDVTSFGHFSGTGIIDWS